MIGMNQPRRINPSELAVFAFPLAMLPMSVQIFRVHRFRRAVE